MKNLKELVAINSSESGEEIINYFKKKLSQNVKEIQIVKNKQN